MTQRTIRTKPVLGLIGVLAALLLLPATAIAAPAAPVLLVSDPVNQGGTYDGTSTYNAAWVDVAISNTGTSSYTQVQVKAEPLIDGVNPGSVSPTGVVARAALDANAIPSPSPYCTKVQNWFECTPPDVPGLSPDGTWKIRFIFSSFGNDFDVKISASIKDLTNTGGSNQDRADVQPKSVSVDVDATVERQTPYFPSDEPFTVSTFKTGPKQEGQKTTLNLPPSPQGYLINLQEASELTQAGCALPVSNFGQTVSADVNSGAEIDPYLQWTLEITDPPYSGKRVPEGVYHCEDGATTPIFISVTLADKCVTDTQVDCMVWNGKSAYTVKSAGKKTWTYTFVVRTLTNGLLKAR